MPDSTMPLDQIVRIEDSIIQHGKLNDRVYLMSLGSNTDVDGLIDSVDSLANEHGYTKIFGKVPECAFGQFSRAGYVPEAKIPGYYRGREDAVIISRFLDPDRVQNDQGPLIAEILDLCKNVTLESEGPVLPDEFTCEVLSEKDIPAMIDLYRQVFASYPFPIHDPGYLFETMNSHVVYFGMKEAGRVVALSSAEIDRKTASVELTDFATQPEYRGKGLAGFLLRHMEEEMIKREIRTGYTIARAVSHGMNLVFAKAGYTYDGTLVNNTNISGSIESMNIWHKKLI